METHASLCCNLMGEPAGSSASISTQSRIIHLVGFPIAGLRLVALIRSSFTLGWSFYYLTLPGHTHTHPHVCVGVCAVHTQKNL